MIPTVLNSIDTDHFKFTPPHPTFITIYHQFHVFSQATGYRIDLFLRKKGGGKGVNPSRRDRLIGFSNLCHFPTDLTFFLQYLDSFIARYTFLCFHCKLYQLLTLFVHTYSVTGQGLGAIIANIVALPNSFAC